jgi:dGTPase
MKGIATPIDSIWAKRMFEDEPQKDDPRTPFQHDRDRILHSTAFRRLQYKTQVYVIHEGDLYRTRLTHSLEVAQIAKGITCRFKANSDLSEAISLAHDLGHPPFGHVGEKKLHELLSKYGIPYEHNGQSYRIVTRLEGRYPSFEGLNLTCATLEGILRHSTPFEPPQNVRKSARGEIRAEVLRYLNYSSQPSFEAQVVNIADIIAYAAHDIEDALAVGLISWEALESEIKREKITFLKEIINNQLKKKEEEYERRCPDATEELIRKVKFRTLSRLIINHLINEVCKETESNLDKLGQSKDLWQKIRISKDPVVAFNIELKGEVENLVQKVLFNNVYQDPRVMIMMEKAKRILGVLFESFMNEPKSLHRVTQARLSHYFSIPVEKRNSFSAEKQLAQVVGDYISGMTDKYAMDMYQLFTQAYEKTL